MASRLSVPLFAALTMAIAGAGEFSASVHGDSKTARREQTMPQMTARGTFKATLTPAGPADETAGAQLGRMTIGKAFAGDVVGTAVGEMLTVLTDVKGSAGYVAVERVSGTVADRRGTFVLQHSGTMKRGEQQLAIAVVPDSGTGALQGIAGVMTIDIAPDGTHSYELTYTLAAP